LTKINSKSTCTSVIHLQCKICKNAMFVRSLNGHLGVIMPPATHSTMQNALSCVDLLNPGALTLAANATAHQIPITKGMHQHNKEEHDAFRELTGKLKQQLMLAINGTCITEAKHEDLACAQCPVAELLNHLVTACGQIEADDIARTRNSSARNAPQTLPLKTHGFASPPATSLPILTNVPGLTLESLCQHPPNSIATAKGHLNQVRRNA
jgi:hypothetical protein